MTGLMTAAVFAAVGGMFSLISVPLIQGKVARNGFYGFRTPKTLSADRIWYPANRYLGRDLFVAGVVIAAGSLLIGLGALMLGLPDLEVALSGLALTTVSVAVTAHRGFRYLRRL